MTALGASDSFGRAGYVHKVTLSECRYVVDCLLPTHSSEYGGNARVLPGNALGAARAGDGACQLWDYEELGMSLGEGPNDKNHNSWGMRTARENFLSPEQLH